MDSLRPRSHPVGPPRDLGVSLTSTTASTEGSGRPSPSLSGRREMKVGVGGGHGKNRVGSTFGLPFLRVLYVRRPQSGSLWLFCLLLLPSPSVSDSRPLGGVVLGEPFTRTLTKVVFRPLSQTTHVHTNSPGEVSILRPSPTPWSLCLWFVSASLGFVSVSREGTVPTPRLFVATGGVRRGQPVHDLRCVNVYRVESDKGVSS